MITTTELTRDREIALNESLARRHFDRRLFMAAAIAFPLIVLAGFGRTYYFKGFFDVPPLASALVHLHGVLMTTWVALFVTQVWFISSRRVRVHQRLGYGAIGLAVLIIAVGFVTAIRAAKFGAASTPPGVSPVAFLIVPLFDLVMFTILFGGAIYYRKKPAQHKALMLLTAVNFVPPAIARIPIAALQGAGPLWFFGFPTAKAKKPQRAGALQRCDRYPGDSRGHKVDGGEEHQCFVLRRLLSIVNGTAEEDGKHHQIEQRHDQKRDGRNSGRSRCSPEFRCSDGSDEPDGDDENGQPDCTISETLMDPDPA